MPSDAYEIAFVRGFCESLAKQIGELMDDAGYVHYRDGSQDRECHRGPVYDDHIGGIHSRRVDAMRRNRSGSITSREG